MTVHPRRVLSLCERTCEVCGVEIGEQDWMVYLLGDRVWVHEDCSVGFGDPKGS